MYRQKTTSTKKDAEYRLEAEIHSVFTVFNYDRFNDRTCGATLNSINYPVVPVQNVHLETVKFTDGSSTGTPLSVRVFSDVNNKFQRLYNNYETKLGLDLSLAEAIQTTPFPCSERLIVQMYTQNLRNVKTQSFPCQTQSKRRLEGETVNTTVPSLETGFHFGADRVPISYNLEVDITSALTSSVSVFDMLDEQSFSALQQKALNTLGATYINAQIQQATNLNQLGQFAFRSFNMMYQEKTETEAQVLTNPYVKLISRVTVPDIEVNENLFVVPEEGSSSSWTTKKTVILAVILSFFFVVGVSSAVIILVIKHRRKGSVALKQEILKMEFDDKSSRIPINKSSSVDLSPCKDQKTDQENDGYSSNEQMKNEYLTIDPDLLEKGKSRQNQVLPTTEQTVRDLVGKKQSQTEFGETNAPPTAKKEVFAINLANPLSEIEKLATIDAQ